MYQPTQFEETSTGRMHDLVRAHPLATLVTLSADGLNANHIPFYLHDDGSPLGTLRGHVARANPLLQDVVANPAVLAIFHGPDCYISPSWYATKQVTGKVVPTWNYAVVHLHGSLRVVDDPVWLRAQLDALTAHNEAAFEAPWQLSDAPVEFTQTIMQAIIGIEIVIEKMSGKWKVSQNQQPQNQASVIEGLRTSQQHDACPMAQLVLARGSKLDKK
ncbi:MAG: FMN-binding negative transcriptional regulator [Pseudomonadota bacterium]